MNRQGSSAGERWPAPGPLPGPGWPAAARRAPVPAGGPAPGPIRCAAGWPPAPPAGTLVPGHGGQDVPVIQAGGDGDVKQMQPPCIW